MAQAEVSGSPQQGVLLRRAHELLESTGQPVSEDLLLQHLFGVTEGTGNSAIWQTLLRKALQSSSLFEQIDEQQWGLMAWRSTHRPLNEIEFVVLDTETTGLRPGPHRVIEVAGIRMRARSCWLFSEPRESRCASAGVHCSIHRYYAGDGFPGAQSARSLARFSAFY